MIPTTAGHRGAEASADPRADPLYYYHYVIITIIITIIIHEVNIYDDNSTSIMTTY